MSLQIQPLRNMIVVKLQPHEQSSEAGLAVIRSERLVRPARIVACGPEVRDLRPGMMALVNTATATQINGCLLVAEATVLGTL